MNYFHVHFTNMLEGLGKLTNFVEFLGTCLFNILCKNEF